MIACSDNFQMTLIKKGLLDVIKSNLNSSSNMIRCQACWILSNIYGGNN